MEADHDGVAPFRDPVGRFSCMADPPWPSFASRPASIRTVSGPQTRCKMGSLVLVGRCYLCGDLVGPRRGTQSAPYRRLCFTSLPGRQLPFLTQIHSCSLAVTALRLRSLLLAIPP